MRYPPNVLAQTMLICHWSKVAFQGTATMLQILHLPHCPLLLMIPSKAEML
jgi:hypothetical protein